MRLTRRGRVVAGVLVALAIVGSMALLEGLSVLLFH
jgi:hypothetical protein